MGPDPVTGGLRRKGHRAQTDTQEEAVSREQSGASTSQGMLRRANARRAGRGRKEPPRAPGEDGLLLD